MSYYSPDFLYNNYTKEEGDEVFQLLNINNNGSIFQESIVFRHNDFALVNLGMGAFIDQRNLDDILSLTGAALMTNVLTEFVMDGFEGDNASVKYKYRVRFNRTVPGIGHLGYIEFLFGKSVKYPWALECVTYNGDIKFDKFIEAFLKQIRVNAMMKVLDR